MYEIYWWYDVATVRTCVSESEMIQRTASSDSNTDEGKVTIHYHGQSTEITGTYIIYYRT